MTGKLVVILLALLLTGCTGGWVTPEMVAAGDLACSTQGGVKVYRPQGYLTVYDVTCMNGATVQGLIPNGR